VVATAEEYNESFLSPS